VTISRNGDGGDDVNKLNKDHPRVFDIYSRLTLRTGVFFLMTASQVVGAQTSPLTVTEAEVLPVILRAALSNGARGDLRVDPRPLIADASYLYAVQPEVIASVGTAVIERRAAIIRAAGLAVVDTTVVNQSKSCPGALVLSQRDSLKGVDNARVVGCPEKPFDILTVGPPRPGSAAIPEDQMYDRSTETAASGYWAVRVIRTTLGHGRSTSFAADYVLTVRGGEWMVVKTVGLMYAE
jgi:hypothetical protein